jgi:hypothetical protein
MEPMTMNWLAVIVAAIAYMILGAIWYSPGLFGKAWMKGIGKTKEELTQGASAMRYIWALILSFIAAYGIARICLWTQCRGIWDGIVIGLLAGVCFVLTTMGINDLFERRPCTLSIINILYHIVGFIVIGIIVGVWH